MAAKVVWTELALYDLKCIVRFVAADSPSAARRLGIRIITRVEEAAEFPIAGRMVPEKRDASLREVILAPYRIIYSIDESAKVMYILRIWHSARGLPP